VSHKPRILPLTISRLCVDSRLVMISAKPKRPIATLTTPSPSVNSGTPNAKRAAPEFTSVPTMPSSRPNTIIAIAFNNDRAPAPRRRSIPAPSTKNIRRART
jgi:hypothetical protein